MPSIIFINKYFAPDHSATSQILTDLATHLAASRFDVDVVTSRQTYGNPNAELPETATLDGVRIHRLTTSRHGRSSLTGRGLDTLSFYRTASRKVRELAHPGDVVVAKTDPPLLSIPIGRAAAARGALVVNWLQDLYPEVAGELGVRVLRGPAGAALARLRDRSLRAAAMNVAIGDRMAARLRGRGIPAARVRVIPNWADEEAIHPVAPEANRYRDELGLRDAFVVGYSGNLGRAHEIDTLLGAAEKLQGTTGIAFLFIGGGHLRGALEAEVRRRGLRGFVFRDYAPREMLSESLTVADVHFVSLRPAMEGLIVPSKIYGIAAAGRPVIAVAAKDGEIGALVARHRFGVPVAPGDASGFADAILALRDDGELRSEMGRNARTVVNGPFAKREALRQWRSLLTELAPALPPVKREPFPAERRKG
ncbi:MAG: glycosyltransferase family 4 protein [Bauldia sp.]